MKLSEILALPNFPLNQFYKTPKSVIYFKEKNITDTKQQKIDNPLYSVVSFVKEGKSIGIIILPKFKFTLYANGVIIEHPNFSLPKTPTLVRLDLSYWSEVHFVTNAATTMTIVSKSHSDTPNY